MDVSFQSDIEMSPTGEETYTNVLLSEGLLPNGSPCLAVTFSNEKEQEIVLLLKSESDVRFFMDLIGMQGIRAFQDTHQHDNGPNVHGSGGGFSSFFAN